MKKLEKDRSFTLIELLVVIVIIGILAGVIAISTSSAITSSQNAKLVANLSNISKSLKGTVLTQRIIFVLKILTITQTFFLA